MKKFLEALKKASEAREALNRYMSETPSDKIDSARVTELRNKLNESESEFRTMVDNAEKEDPEDKGKQDLGSRIELRNYMTCALRGERVQGAEAEFNKEVGISDIGFVPWEALEDRSEDRQEDRTDDATTVAAEAISHSGQAILRRIFRRSRTSFMGMRMPSVSSGEPVYPVMTGGIDYDSGGAYTQGSSVEADAATFTGKMVSPKRISARYKFQIEDAAKFAGLEDVLRSDLRMVMNQLLDTQVFNGTGAAGQFNGLLRNHADGPLGVYPAALNDARAYNIAHATALNAINNGIESYSDYIDGEAAALISETRSMVGIDTYKRFLQALTDQEGLSIANFLARHNASYAAWKGIPAPAAVGGKNAQLALQTRRGGDVIVPIWQGVMMIRDPYSEAAKAEVAITAHMLANIEVLRTDNWRGIIYQLAA